MVPPPKVEYVEPKRVDQIGDNMRLKFKLWRYKGYYCKVFRRLRWADKDEQRIVRDWKIMVKQKDGAQDKDYLVVKKLPCRLFKKG